MAVQVLGKVAYFNKGAYNSQTNYEINDVVSYNGSSYVSLNNNNQGNLPTNTNYWSVVAEKGDKGDTGKPFVIEKTYSSIESMVADYDNMNVNDYVMIQGSIEEQENATLWTKREVEVAPYKWAYLADFSGASGITGATPNIHIGNVTEGNEPSVTRRSGSSNENPILDFVLKTGAKGDTGATGNGISSIEKTSTSGLVDTYTITFTNGTSTTIEVTNGRGIVSIAKTSSVDYVDTYTITYNDGTTSTFEVANSEVTEEEFDEVVDELNYLYDDLPKVEGEGTSLTLDNTRKGKMSTTLKGNLSQKTNIITYTCLGTETGDYYFVYDSINYQFTMPTISSDDVLVFNTDTLKLYLDTIEIPTTTASTGTLITMNTTPNPDYPQDVEVVSGNNTIKVEGKNLCNGINQNVYLNNTTNQYGVASNNSGLYIQVSGGNYTISTTKTQERYRVACSNNEPSTVAQTSYRGQNKDNTSNSITIDTTGYSYLIVNATDLSAIQIEKGTTATPYEPYQSQTYPINLGVENLWKNQLSGFLSQSGTYPTTNSSYPSARYVLIPLIAGQSITLSGSTSANGRVRYIDKSTNQVVGTISQETNAYYTSTAHFTTQFNNGTITANKEFIVGIMDMSGNVDDLVVNYGTRPSTISDTPIELCKIEDYQDYIYKDSGKWYKHSEIGKQILDGTEAWVYSVANLVFYSDVIQTPQVVKNSSRFYCNRFNYVSWNTFFKNILNGQGRYQADGDHRLILKNTACTTSNDFKNWLSTNNTIVYYVLATPTNTEITDQTLIAQLDNFEKAISYNTQTNISQENNDLPFIISASAFMSLKYLFGNLETRVAELETSEPSEL